MEIDKRCEECSCSFDDEEMWFHHITTLACRVLEASLKKGSMEIEEEAKETEDAQKGNVCGGCKIRFDGREDLSQHLRSKDCVRNSSFLDAQGTVPSQSGSVQEGRKEKGASSSAPRASPVRRTEDEEDDKGCETNMASSYWLFNYPKKKRTPRVEVERDIPEEQEPQTNEAAQQAQEGEDTGCERKRAEWSIDIPQKKRSPRRVVRRYAAQVRGTVVAEAEEETGSDKEKESDEPGQKIED